jgi:hypothetical protein
LVIRVDEKGPEEQANCWKTSHTFKWDPSEETVFVFNSTQFGFVQFHSNPRFIISIIKIVVQRFHEEQALPPLTGSLAPQWSSPVALDNQRHPALNNTQHCSPPSETCRPSKSCSSVVPLNLNFKLKGIIAALRRPRQHKSARQSNTRQPAHRSLTFHQHGNYRVPSIQVPFFY